MGLHIRRTKLKHTMIGLNKELKVHLVAVLRHPRHHHIRVQLTLDSQRSFIHPRDGPLVTGQRGWRVMGRRYSLHHLIANELVQIYM